MTAPAAAWVLTPSPRAGQRVKSNIDKGTARRIGSTCDSEWAAPLRAAQPRHKVLGLFYEDFPFGDGFLGATFFAGVFLAWAKSEAATDLTLFEDPNLRKSLPAMLASFLPVVMDASFHISLPDYDSPADLGDAVYVEPHLNVAIGNVAIFKRGGFAERKGEKRGNHYQASEVQPFYFCLSSV